MHLKDAGDRQTTARKPEERRATDDFARWGDAMQPATFAFPLAAALVVGGVCGYFGKASALQLALTALTAVSMQLANNVARVYGDRIDRHSARTEYYERKFAKYRSAGAAGRMEAPMQGAVIDSSAIRLRAMLALSAAAALVLGYALIVSCTEIGNAAASMAALTCHVLAVGILLTRYLGPWCFGYRTYGNIVLFVLLAVCSGGSLLLLMGTFVPVMAYPALALASLGVAAANMRDLACERHDVEMSHTRTPRRTVPLSAGFKGAVICQAAFETLGVVWLVMFPAAVGAANIWNYAFAIFFIPMAGDLVSILRAKPDDVGALQKSLGVSMLLLGAAFFLSLASGNMETLLALA